MVLRAFRGMILLYPQTPSSFFPMHLCCSTIVRSILPNRIISRLIYVTIWSTHFSNKGMKKKKEKKNWRTKKKSLTINCRWQFFLFSLLIAASRFSWTRLMHYQQQQHFGNAVGVTHLRRGLIQRGWGKKKGGGGNESELWHGLAAY